MNAQLVINTPSCEVTIDLTANSLIHLMAQVEIELQHRGDWTSYMLTVTKPQ